MTKKSSNRIVKGIQNAPRWVISLIDACIASFALLAAYLIRYDVFADFQIFNKDWQELWIVFPYVIGLKLLVFYVFKIHKGIVRHTSFEDVSRIFFATLTFSLLLFGLGSIRYFVVDGKFIVPTSVLIVEFFISLFVMVASRFLVKVLYASIQQKFNKKPAVNVILYGAGASGLITKQTIEGEPEVNYNIVAYIDDDPRLHGNRMEGVPICHPNKLVEMIEKDKVTELIVSIQRPNKKNVSRIANICLEHNVKVKRVPNFNRWINGELSVNQIRNIDINDLLGREPIKLDINKIEAELKNKVVLVTGAAGSIGSEITRQVLTYAPQQVILFDQWESGLYDLQIDLISQGLDACMVVVIGDIRDRARLRCVFEEYHPDMVFHAAAYKHVPLMEDNPTEAVKTNVLGTKNIVDLAGEYQAKKMVMISTDKAVNPTNIMGASKRIAEIYAQTKNKTTATQYITTRFGNVLGSNGSVIPLFKKQIDKGGPLTVTHKDITRYFMTIPEACELVLQAGTMGHDGEIFVFDMGDPVKIIDLAKKMIKFSGLELNKDIEIKITGLRPGEKLYEELLANTENTLPTIHSKILKAKVVDYGISAMDEVNELIALFDNASNETIVRKMKQIVPEFVSNNSVYTKLDNIDDQTRKDKSKV